MIILKYTKQYPASLAGHVDTLRTVAHILRRANCKVDYSKGFNPHMELVFSPALSLGIESLCEYVWVSTQDYDAIMQLNKYCPPAFKFVKWWQVDGTVNLPSIIDSAQYNVCCANLSKAIPNNITQNYIMSVPSKSGMTDKDIAERILAVKAVDKDNVEFKLACGNTNLRCDLLVKNLLDNANIADDYSILKTCAYVGQTDADTYLDGICNFSGKF